MKKLTLGQGDVSAQGYIRPLTREASLSISTNSAEDLSKAIDTEEPWGSV